MADITPSMLSQIERGSANPSIQTLKVLAKALDVPTFSFLLEDTNTDDLIVRSHKRKKNRLSIIYHMKCYHLISQEI